MHNSRHILEKYSKEMPISPTLRTQKEIIGALSPHLTEDQLMRIVHKTDWHNHEAIKALCQQKLTSILIVDRDDQLESKKQELITKIHNSLERQKKRQQEGIDEKKVQHISSLSPHTLIDLLGKRTSKAEYKFQTSRTPLFEDAEGIEHYAIEPYGSKK